MLAKYPIFWKLGFFGVQPGTRHGAIEFVRRSESILSEPAGLLAVTAQARFADIRERPARLARGLGYLAKRVQHALFVPLAIEYVFWNQRLPEVLLHFGEATEVRSAKTVGTSSSSWPKVFERKLESTQDALSLEAQKRDATAFDTILRGGAGQGGIYDWWRALRARLRGQRFSPEHGL